jgi:hypothetical protein
MTTDPTSPGSTGWAWFALVDEEAGGADLCARVSELDGAPAGLLAAWRRRAKPLRAARRIHDSVLDPGGAPATVSLVLPPAGVKLAFDDLAVQQARRAVLLGRPPDAVSTLLTDASHFEGSVTVLRGDDAETRAAVDPFARIFPARVLRVGAGLFGRAPAPAGPTIERYGSAQPWPGDRFVSA